MMDILENDVVRLYQKDFESMVRRDAYLSLLLKMDEAYTPADTVREVTTRIRDVLKKEPRPGCGDRDTAKD